jgi:cycloeucalenol cycloisomerase
MSGWFSSNPDKAWAEKFFLLYIPFFIALNASKQAFGWMNVGTFWHLVQNLSLLLPLVVVPLLFYRPEPGGGSWHEQYWFKAVIWMMTFNFVATYFLTEYFFDVLGMVYHFPAVSLHFDSALVGTNQLHVPLGMYFNAPAFFIVYHTLAVVMIRKSCSFASGVWSRRVGFVISVLIIAVLMAWLETRLIATDANSESFYYKDLDKMLLYGSWFYACYFLASFPMYFRLEEEVGEVWSIGRVIVEALAAGMMAMILVDFATHLLGGSL